MEIVLKRGETLVIDGDPRRQSIACRRGELWLTQFGDPRDYPLRAGESMTVTQRGRVVVWALSDATLAVCPAANAAPAFTPACPSLVCRA